jgi:carotenoid cleavage dioxygenase-like enzyme
VIDRGSGEVQRTFEAQPCFAFHHVNAFERGSELVADICTYRDPGVIGALYLDSLRDGSSPMPTAQLRRYRLGLATGRVEEETLVDNVELPRIDYRVCNGRPHRYVYGIGSGADAASFLDRIVKVDTDSGESLTWSEDGCHPGEPIFVPTPGERAEDGGVLLSVTLDERSGTSFLLVLDAADLGELARAQVPHHIPFSFHGQFFGDVS